MQETWTKKKETMNKSCSLYTLDWLSTWRLFIQTVFILALQTKCFFFFRLLGKNTKSFSMCIKYHSEKNHNEKIKLFKFLKLAYAFKIFGKYIWSISSLVLFGGCWAVNCFFYFLNFAVEPRVVEDFIPWCLGWILLKIITII